jgi:hypothetical protein
MSEQDLQLADKLLSLFKIRSGLEFVTAEKALTPKQKEIFISIILRKIPRLQIITSTQYGKSLTVSLAAIILTCVMKEVVSIVAPSNEKAKIIMRYYIEHLGDSPVFYEQLEKDTKLERLRMEESKDRIMLKNGGGIYVVSAQASNSRRGIEAAMGSGAKITILDEGGLIPDPIEATIFRMVAGFKDGFYCKIGNPFYRNHFYTSWMSPLYQKIFVDYKIAMAEGRYNQDFIEEAKTKPYFSVLFECVFPSEDEIDDAGYLPLISERDLRFNAKEGFGEKRLGVDVAEWGGNYNVIVLRTADTAKVLLRWRSENTMSVAGMVLKYAKEYDILDNNIFIDEIGVGKGVVDRLREQKNAVHGVKSSEEANDPVQFFNTRAEVYWRLKQWLRDAELEPSELWKEILGMRYKVVESSGRLMMMPKELMRTRGYQSPDVADALALTFARKSVINPKAKEDRDTLKQFDFWRNKAKNKLFTGSKYLRRGGI